MRWIAVLAGALALAACESVEGGGGQSSSSATPASTLAALVPWTGAAQGIRPAANGAAYYVLRESGAGETREPGWLEMTYQVLNAQTGANLGEGVALQWAPTTSTDMLDSLGLIDAFSGVRGQTRIGGDYVYYLPQGDTRDVSQLFRVAYREVAPGPDNTETMAPWDSDRAGVQKPDGPGGMEYYVKASGDPAGATLASMDTQASFVMEGVAWTPSALPAAGPIVFMKSTPINSQPRNLIAGVQNAVMRMRPGDVWYVYVPNNLGYGPNPPPGSRIHPTSHLLFKIEMQGAQ